MMKNIYVLFAACIVAGLGFVGILHAEIYQWTDSNGSVHFSDQPHSGAKEVNLPAIQSSPSSTGMPVQESHDSDAASGLVDQK